MHANERVDRIMSAALSIDVEESAGAMLRMFADYPIHHLPVVRGRKVVGMLSSADVTKLAALLPKTGVAYNELLDQPVGAAALMSEPVITIQPHRSLIDAADLMASHGIHALPVVDAQGCFVGIVTTTDIIRAALQPAPTRA
jgi:CBS domain-containing membrane protein